jgi:hypothetical protein
MNVYICYVRFFGLIVHTLVKTLTLVSQIIAALVKVKFTFKYNAKEKFINV